MVDWIASLNQHVKAASDAVAAAAVITARAPGIIQPSDDNLSALLSLRATLGLPAYAATQEQMQAVAARWPALPNLASLLHRAESALADAAGSGRMNLLPRPPASAMMRVADQWFYSLRIRPDDFGAVVLVPDSSPWRTAFPDEQAVLARIPSAGIHDFPSWIDRTFVESIPASAGLSADRVHDYNRQEQEIESEIARLLLLQEQRKRELEAQRNCETIRELVNSVQFEQQRRAQREANQVRYR